MKRSITLSLILFVTSAHAGEVIDLGRLQIDGKMRGPEVQLVDPNRISEQTAGKMVQSQLKLLEGRLLKTRRPDEDSRQSPASPHDKENR